jgi:hypothetical protein
LVLRALQLGECVAPLLLVLGKLGSVKLHHLRECSLLVLRNEIGKKYQYSNNEFRKKYRYSKAREFRRKHQYSKSDFRVKYECSRSEFNKKYEYSKERAQ